MRPEITVVGGRQQLQHTRRALLSAASAGAIALAIGCAGGEQAPAAPKDRAPVQIAVTLSVSNALEPIQGRLRDMFRAAYPWIQVEESGDAGVDVTYQRLLTLAAAGTPPEVGWLHPSYVSDLAEKSLLVDLGPLAGKDREANLPDFYAGILDHFRFRAATYGLPWNSGPTVTFFNRTLFDRLGIKPPDQREKEGTWTWAALREAARAVTQTTGNTPTMGLEPPSAALDWFDAWVWQAGGDIFSKDLKSCLLTSPPALEAAQFLADLHLKDQVIPTGDAAKQYPGGIESGRVAMRIGIKGQVNRVTEKASDANFQLGMAPTPKGRNGRANRDGPQAFGLLTGSKHQDAGWEYVKFMSNLETQKVRFEAKVTVPVRKAAAKLPEFARSLEPWEVGEWWTEAAATTRNLPKPPRYGEIDAVWQAAWKNILAGQQPLRTGIEDATRQINALLTGA